MKLNDIPKLMPVPFGVSGPRTELLPSSPAGDRKASYKDGFPPITMLLKSAGGLPPDGGNMNQILFELASGQRWSNAGARYKFNETFSDAVGGYPKGAQLLSNDGTKVYVSTKDDNKTDFNTSPGSDWVTLGDYIGLGDYATKTEVGLKLDKNSVVQSTGTSTVNVMSQKTVTDELNKKFDKIGGMVSGQVDIASPGGRALTLKPVGESETSVYLEGYLNNILKWWLGMTGGNTVTLENTVTSRKMEITDKFNVNGQLDVESNGGRVNTLKATAGTSVYQELYLQASLAAWWGITNSNKLSIANVVTGNTLTIGDDGFRIDGKVIGKEESIIGIGQTYKDVTSTRKSGVTYTNTSTKPIIIYVESNRTAATESDAYSIGGEVNGIRVAYRWTTANETMSISFIVPPGASYMFKGGWGQTHPWEPVLKVVELS
ncbi:hypothetical protein ACGABU_003454 [Morganella morganii]